MPSYFLKTGLLDIHNLTKTTTHKILSPQDQLFIDKLSKVVESNLEIRQFGVEDLAREVGMSRSMIYRRLQSISGRSVSQFIRDIRLEKAMELLVHNAGTVTEISYRVGFGSPAYFNTCFHERYGYPPGEVKYRDLQKNKKRSLFSNKWWWISFSILSILAISFLVFRFLKIPVEENKKSTISEKSIAVLPFKNLSNEDENEFFAYGIVDNILSQLAGIRGIRTISRTSSESSVLTSKSSPQIGRELGANFILEGSVQKYGDDMRIIVQLIQANIDKHIWSEQFDIEPGNILHIQHKIAKNVAAELNTILSEAEILPINQLSTENAEAYNLYVRGRFFLNKSTEEDFHKSLDYFSRAIEIDPDYSLAYAGLADTYLNLTNWKFISYDEGYPKAKDYALRALNIDNSLAEANTTLADIYWKYEGNFKQSELLFKRAIEISPYDANAYHSYANFLWNLGRHREAREQINKAKDLDPLSELIYASSAYQYYHEDLQVNALSDLNKILEIDSEFVEANYLLFLLYRDMGMPDQSFGAFKKVKKNFKDEHVIDEIYHSHGIDGILSYLIDFGKQQTSPRYFHIAEYYAMLGQKEEALSCLEKFINKEYSVWDDLRVLNNSHFEQYRHDLGFQEIFGEIEHKYLK